ncbi:hypothetical protein [Halioxenophilus sp. WMMB6]|uniref:hypothetical protein n=1 Tax=Halioxenophilus sp. WMMB6 TaxID=3073815 RepID=UPI00295E4826|nr:hypothetical protein [Halioxenophilus sp. WMMB6]
MDRELEHQVVALLHSGHKIDAIKKLRELRHISLEEARELIDDYNARHIDSSPNLQPSRGNNLLLMLIFLAALGYLLYQTLVD